jgi:hypothetical protein
MNELLFWSESKLGRFLLLVLENEPSHSLPMAFISTEDGNRSLTMTMPQTILAELAREDEIPEDLMSLVNEFRKKD